MCVPCLFQKGEDAFSDLDTGNRIATVLFYVSERFVLFKTSLLTYLSAAK